MASLKLAICVPCYDRVHSKWAQSLALMVAHFMRSKLTDADGNEYDKEIETFFVSSSLLIESRHLLVAEAVMWGADYILWMDSDHVFPAASLCRLWARNVDIVGVNYARRCLPTAPTAAKMEIDHPVNASDNLVYTTKDKYEGDVLEEVSHMGFGLCLMKTSIFDRMQEYAEAKGDKSFMPLFLFQLKEDGMGIIGEDVHFFKKCREAGIKVHCDHGVSGEVGHISEQIISNADACRQKDDWNGQAVAFTRRIEDSAQQAEVA